MTKQTKFCLFSIYIYIFFHNAPHNLLALRNTSQHFNNTLREYFQQQNHQQKAQKYTTQLMSKRTPFLG